MQSQSLYSNTRCYVPVRALQAPLANTGTYNPNRQLTPSTSRNPALVFYERKPHTWVPHETHMCGVLNVARQLVVFARRSAGRQRYSPLPQHRRSRGISRGDRRSKRGPHTWVLYVTLTWEASNGTGQLYTRRSIAAVFSRKYPMAQRSRGTPSDDRRSRRTPSMPPQSHPPMKYRGDQKKVFSLCSQHTGGGRCGHGDPEGSKAF